MPSDKEADHTHPSKHEFLGVYELSFFKCVEKFEISGCVFL